MNRNVILSEAKDPGARFFVAKFILSLSNGLRKMTMTIR